MPKTRVVWHILNHIIRRSDIPENSYLKLTFWLAEFILNRFNTVKRDIDYAAAKSTYANEGTFTVGNFSEL